MSIAQHAVGGKKRTTLNYKKADKYDKGKTKVRRQFAAGWLWSGKKITNISKTELKKVKKHLPKRKRPMPMGIMLADGVSCPGRSGVVKRSNGIDVYLNKCETTNLKVGLNTVAWITATVAVGIGVRPPGVVSGVVAALASGGSDMIDAPQDYSGTGSIWFRVRSTPLGLTTYVLPQP